MHYELKKWKHDFQITDKLYNRMLRNIAVPVAAAFVPILGSILCAVCVFSCSERFVFGKSAYKRIPLIYIFYAITETGIQTSNP